MKSVWFFYERCFSGEYKPAKMSMDPGTVASYKGRTRDVRKLSMEEWDDDLATLEARYPLKADVTTVETASDDSQVDED